MPKRRSKIGDDIQPNLFSNGGALPGSDNLGSIVRGVITKVCHESRSSREQLADRMTELLGVRVTVRMLNDWTADSKEMHRFPLEFVLAFCHAAENFELIAAVVGRCGAKVISNHQARLLEFAQASLDKELADRRHEYQLAALAHERPMQ